MLVCRTFSRADRVWNAVNATYILSKTTDCSQGHLCYHNLIYVGKMSGAKHGKMDQTKKQRTVTPVWRPVCTQPSPSEGCVAKEVKVVHTVNSYEAVNCKASSVTQNFSEENESTSVQGQVAVEHVQITGLQVHSVIGAERHSTSVQVDTSLIRFIKGKGGSTQKQIEGELGVKITFSTSKDESSIVIEGPSIESITKASEKIQVLLEEAVKSPNLDYSHFISLPLAVHTELVEKLTNFQGSILGNNDTGEGGSIDSDSNEEMSEDGEDNCSRLDGPPNVAVKLEVQNAKEHVKVDINKIIVTSYAPKAQTRSSVLSDSGIDRSIFIKPKTFHLTVLMLKLWNKERVAAATEVLLNISSKVKDALKNRPVFVRLKGLERMKGSPSNARVLYAPVEEIGGEDRLLRACEVITEAFVEAGLVLEKDAYQKLKLHATVMNVRHRKRKKRMRRFDSFDARDIFKRYGSEDWGEYLISEAHLSQRFQFDDNGYYHCCASIPFPEITDNM